MGRRSGRDGDLRGRLTDFLDRRSANQVAPRAKPLIATRNRGLAASLARLARAIDTEATILILGAPGTGKDRLAETIHARSVRAPQPFVRIDLAAIADDLFESELFGYERGSFTGAMTSKPGLLEGADNGTIYLDRIDVISGRAQGKLLRVLEERAFRRVGGTRQLKAGARFIASALQDLPKRVRGGDFREDLYYRLAVVTIVLPPLSERLADLASVARAFLRADGLTGVLTPEVAALLRGHPWRGNWRELESVLKRAIQEARARGGDTLLVSDLALEPLPEAEGLLRTAVRLGWSLSELERRYIGMVLEESGGNISEAARRLGISRKTLYERIAAKR